MKKDYSNIDYSIKNPLNMELKDKRYCPICGKYTNDGNITGGVHKLFLGLYTGNPCTKQPKRKDLTIFMCYKCRTEIYNTLEKKIAELRRGQE